MSACFATMWWILVVAAAFAVIAVLAVAYNAISAARIPAITVPLPSDTAENGSDQDTDGLRTIKCYDPATLKYLATMPAMTADEVKAVVDRARIAAKEWKKSTFAQRRLLLKTFLKYMIEHQEDICRVAARDSGKALVDAAFGEILCTCEKIWWLIKEGEKFLKPESRSAGIMMFYKAARVEYHPVGVVGAIVPWNYPFHNVFNPVTAAVFAGNAIVVKVSEHASWSALYYGAIIREALKAVGAPPDLIQIVTGYGEAGHALVTSGLGKLIFVGSTGVGRKVMQAAAEKLTPVVLELGGKDAFIVCDDADLSQVVPTALRAAFQSCGQNCCGAERFIVHEKVYGKFLEQVVSVVRKMRQGDPLSGHTMDCGAMCMPGQAQKVHHMVQDAMSRGAKLMAGGELPSEGGGQFYPPTVLADVPRDSMIWREEVFGPVFTVVQCSSDEEAVQMANDCDFGLGSAVFSGSKARARRIAQQLEAGMTSINDFAATYMAQSLPFGGVKDSGFDRFAGVEGLRGMCVPKAVAEDRLFFKTTIPPLLQYPVSDAALSFVCSLVRMFYSLSVLGQVRGLLGVIKCVLPGASKSKQA